MKKLLKDSTGKAICDGHDMKKDYKTISAEEGVLYKTVVSVVRRYKAGKVEPLKKGVANQSVRDYII